MNPGSPTSSSDSQVAKRSRIPGWVIVVIALVVVGGIAWFIVESSKR